MKEYRIKTACHFEHSEKSHKVFKLMACIVLLLYFFSCKQDIKNTKLSGNIFGTFYEVTYASEQNYQKQFDSLFYAINKSMSTYQVNSDISKLNRNETVEIDGHFKRVFLRSKDIYKETNGAFDPTIGAVVNAWDFGPEGTIIKLDSVKIDSLMTSVGFDKVNRMDNNITKPKNTFIDFNAIAKGYAVDVIGEFLERKKVTNYLINIGGELRARGINKEKDKGWTVAVENPNFDGSQSWDTDNIFVLKDAAMATSGTYRKFKVDENGNRYSHIIDTKTGYPSKTNLLSITVITDNCMTADAYATAFKTMGIENIKTFLRDHPELKVLLIFENENKAFETLTLNGFPE